MEFLMKHPDPIHSVVRRLRGGHLLLGTALAGLSANLFAQDLPGTAAPAAMPHLNVVEMFMHADVLVKGVMVFLMLCSVLTWALAIEKSIVLGRARRDSRHFVASMRGAKGVDEIDRKTVDAPASAIGAMWQAAKREWDLFQTKHRGKSVTPHQVDGLLSRMVVAANVVQEEEMQRLSRSMGILATIGSTAPFIGLFGTVWGILNSFIGIAASHTTSLAVVAPGIAEALLATAIGLFTAIPAVMIYNKFAREISQITGSLDNFQGELSTVVSRETEVLG